MSEKDESDPTRLNDHYFMGLALEEARTAHARSEVPVGAIIVGDGGVVLAKAHNAPITLFDPTAHAEILALRQASKALGNYRLPGIVLYVTLEPCVMCVGAMLHARVRRLVFGAYDSKSGAAGSVLDLTRVPTFNHYVEVTGGVRSQESAELLKLFFHERRSKIRSDIV